MFAELNALEFENAAREGQMVLGSPLTGHEVWTTVDEVLTTEPQALRRIFATNTNLTRRCLRNN